MSDHARSTCHSLLIGIDAYPKSHKNYLALTTCANDVREILKSLKEKMTPNMDLRNKNLVAAGGENAPQPDSEPEDKPTYENIMASLKDIVEFGREGDSVFIHYSGHGTRVPPGRNKYSNHNTGDLAWVALGESDKGVHVRYVHGRQLANRLKAMVDKGMRVTLILDCCNSGSMFRHGAHNDGSEIRYLQYDAEVDAAFPDLENEGVTGNITILDEPPEENDDLFRDSSMLPNWMINPEGFAIITACEPHEVAQHVGGKDGIPQHGALSYALIKAFQDPDTGEFDGHCWSVYQNLLARFRQMYPSQNPMWYGARELGPHGLNIRDRSRHVQEHDAYIITENQDGGDSNFQLHGGLAHGIRANDLFEVPRFGMRFIVKHVLGLTSSLDLITTESSHRREGHLRGKQITWFSIQHHPVQVDLDTSSLSHDLASYTEWRSQRPWITLQNGGDGYRLRVRAMPSATGYEILDSSDEPIDHVPRKIFSITQALDIIEHLLKYYIFKELCNDKPEDSLEQACKIQLTNANGTIIQPGVITNITHRDILSLSVQNNGLGLLYVHMYNLRPRWDIRNMMDASYYVLQPANHTKNPRQVKTAFGRKGNKDWTIHETIPDELLRGGCRRCDDTIKVFITKRPTSFTPWELPMIGRVMEDSTGEHTRGSDGDYYGDGQTWSAWTFHLHISTSL